MTQISCDRLLAKLLPGILILSEDDIKNVLNECLTYFRENITTTYAQFSFDNIIPEVSICASLRNTLNSK